MTGNPDAPTQSRLSDRIAAQLALVPPHITAGGKTFHEVVFLKKGDSVATQVCVTDCRYVPLPQELADDLGDIVRVICDPLVPRVTAEVFHAIQREVGQAATQVGGGAVVALLRDRVQQENPLLFQWMQEMVQQNAEGLADPAMQTRFLRACFGTLIPMYMALERQAREDANRRLQGEGPVRDTLAIAVARLVEAQACLEAAKAQVADETARGFRHDVDGELLEHQLEKVGQVLQDVSALRGRNPKNA